MPTRNAQAHWTGGLKDGRGWLKSQSGTVEGAYSFPTRFENAPGTNTARHLNRLVLRQAQDEVLMLSLSKHEAPQTYDFICRGV